MSSIQESYQKIGELLFDPLAQSPTGKMRFGAIVREFQNFSNELNNTNQRWSYTDFNVTLNDDGEDILVPNSRSIGKILFVSGNSDSPYYNSIEFVDLSDASTDWWSYSAVDRPFYDGYYDRYSGQIAFYRKNGLLYIRSNPRYYGNEFTITAATGDWSKNMESVPIFREYHHLPEIRAAKNLLPACKWSSEMDKREVKLSLDEQEARVLKEFREAKRSMVQDDVTFRDEGDEW